MTNNNKEDWHEYYKKQRIEEDIKKEKQKTQKFPKSYIIGLIGGIFITQIIFQMGGFGFIPAFIIGIGSILIVTKIAKILLGEKNEKSEEPIREHIDNPKQQNTQNEVKNIEPKKSKKGFIWAGVVIIAIIFIVAVFSNIPNEQDVELVKTDKSGSYSEQDGNLYRNTKYDFRIKFPEGWEIKPGDGPNILQKAVSGNYTISVGVREIPAELGDKVATIKNMATLSDFKDEGFSPIKNKFPDAQILDYGESKLDNEPTYWMKYAATYNALDINVRGINLYYGLLKNNIFYFINVGAPFDEFSLIEPEFMKSIATFVIEDY